MELTFYLIAEGTLIIKILKRTAEFTIETVDFNDRRHERSGSLQIPKKTKVFIEQTIRERDNAPGILKIYRKSNLNKYLSFHLLAIYNNFLTELWRLRLIAARETVDVINSAECTISGDIGQTPIKLAAEVCGLGPIFQLLLIIENMSSRKVAADLCVLLHCDHRHFLLKKPFQKLPLIVPNAPIKISFQITAVVDPNDGLQPSDLTPETANIRVMILKSNHVSAIDSKRYSQFKFFYSFAGKTNIGRFNCNANTRNVSTGYLLINNNNKKIQF